MSEEEDNEIVTTIGSRYDVEGYAVSRMEYKYCTRAIEKGIIPGYAIVRRECFNNAMYWYVYWKEDDDNLKKDGLYMKQIIIENRKEKLFCKWMIFEWDPNRMFIRDDE